MENNQTMKASETVKIDELLKDAKLYVKEAETQIREWHIKLSERQRHLETIEIVKAKK